MLTNLLEDGNIANVFWRKTEQSSFLRLALDANLDEETAYTICQLIDLVGWNFKGEKWDDLEERPVCWRKRSG